MKRLILVGGMPASGKTLFAWLLRDTAGIECLSTDFVYYDMAKELEREPRNFANPREWKGIDAKLFADLRHKHYREFLAKNKGDQLIIEGLHVSLAADRNEIIKALNPEEIVFFHREVNFSDWLLQKGKARDASAWNEYAWLKSITTVPNRYDKRHKINVLYVRSDTDRAT